MLEFLVKYRSNRRRLFYLKVDIEDIEAGSCRLKDRSKNASPTARRDAHYARHCRPPYSDRRMQCKPPYISPIFDAAHASRRRYYHQGWARLLRSCNSICSLAAERCLMQTYSLAVATIAPHARHGRASSSAVARHRARRHTIRRDGIISQPTSGQKYATVSVIAAAPENVPEAKSTMIVDEKCCYMSHRAQRKRSESIFSLGRDSSKASISV